MQLSRDDNRQPSRRFVLARYISVYVWCIEVLNKLSAIGGHDLAASDRVEMRATVDVMQGNTQAKG
ncbi:MAG TPA: hypothetical protein VGD04_02740 [Methylophilus sp.]